MTSSEIRTSPKKARKPQARSLPLRAAIRTIAAEYDRLTVRQLFYQLVARRAIEKTENAYDRVCDATAQMRLAGELDYRKIADGHRSRRKPWAFDGLGEALQNTQQLYRRNYWLYQPFHVEIWCEKDALTGVIEPVCRRYGVPYIATRGFPSLTLIYESAHAMIETGKRTLVFYFGDHDASGRAISQNLEPGLRGHGADVTVERIALEPQQIHRFGLPVRPGKMKNGRYSDSRHPKFAAEYGGGCVELDALPPDELTRMVSRVIVNQIDRESWAAMEEIEEQERVTLESLAACKWEAGVQYSTGAGSD